MDKSEGVADFSNALRVFQLTSCYHVISRVLAAVRKAVAPGLILLTIHYPLLTTYTRRHLLLTSYFPLPTTHYPLLETTYLAHLCHLEGGRDDGIEAHNDALVRPNLQEVARTE